MKQVKIRYYLEVNRAQKGLRDSKELIMSELNYAYQSHDSKGNSRYKPLRYSLQANILPKNFGLAKNNYKFDKEVFDKYSRTDSTIKNRMLHLEKAINEITNHYIDVKKIPNPQEFGHALDLKLNRIKVDVKNKVSILEYLTEKIIDFESNVNTQKKDSKTANTIKNYKTLQHHIENFQIAKNEVLYLIDFDSKKYWELWDTLDSILRGEITIKNPNQSRTQKIQENGYLANAINKHQKSLLHILKSAIKDGIKVPLDVTDTNLVIKASESSKSFYINEETLKKVYSTVLDADKDLQLAKDYLIIACLTGMRYESMVDAKKSEILHFEDDVYSFDYIHSKQNKTQTELYIPLLNPVREILDRYGKFPTFKANSDMNESLKGLFSFLEINYLVELKLVTYKNGTITTKEKVSNLISTHDCKGSFFTNLYNLGVNQAVISTITHPDKPQKNLMARIYNKAEMLDRAKFFVSEIKKVKSELYCI